MGTTLEPISAPAGAHHIDRRDSSRKPCRVRASLDVGGRSRLLGKTLDLSHTGISLLLPQALHQGCVGDLCFSVFVNGSLELVRARIEVANCVFLSAEVRVGCRFVELESSSKCILAAMMR